MPALPPILEVRHRLPGRLRLRLAPLRGDPEGAARLAASLAAAPGVHEVRAHPRTGSVLVQYDPARVDADELVERARAAAGTDLVLRPGAPDPRVDAALAAAAHAQGTELARRVAGLFKGLDAELLRWSGGKLGLGGGLSYGLALAGVAKIALSGELPLPEWHQLFWWSFRSFMVLEPRAVGTTPHPLATEEPAP
jgi:copper chaperone CopZ